MVGPDSHRHHIMGMLFEQALSASPSPYSHFEFYTPLNSLMMDTFSLRSEAAYMVTPPHKRSGDEDPIELEGGGALTTACFIVSKILEDINRPSTYRNMVVMALHIRRGDETAPAARARVARFLMQKAGEECVPNLKAILLLGSEIEVYSLVDGSPDAKISDEVITFSNPAGPELRSLLNKIAVENCDVEQERDQDQKQDQEGADEQEERESEGLSSTQ